MTKRIVFLTVCLIPLLAGARCSGSAVAQAGATTAVNAVANNIVELLFDTIRGMGG